MQFELLILAIVYFGVALISLLLFYYTYKTFRLNNPTVYLVCFWCVMGIYAVLNIIKLISFFYFSYYGDSGIHILQMALSPIAMVFLAAYLIYKLSKSHLLSMAGLVVFGTAATVVNYLVFSFYIFETPDPFVYKLSEYSAVLTGNFALLMRVFMAMVLLLIILNIGRQMYRWFKYRRNNNLYNVWIILGTLVFLIANYYYYLYPITIQHLVLVNIAIIISGLIIFIAYLGKISWYKKKLKI